MLASALKDTRLEDVFRQHPTLQLVKSTDIGNENTRHEFSYLVAVGHLIMEICFENYTNPLEAGVTLALTLTALFISIFVIWDEKK